MALFMPRLDGLWSIHSDRNRAARLLGAELGWQHLSRGIPRAIPRDIPRAIPTFPHLTALTAAPGRC